MPHLEKENREIIKKDREKYDFCAPEKRLSGGVNPHFYFFFIYSI
jgi:hypothetical protein